MNTDNELKGHFDAEVEKLLESIIIEEGLSKYEIKKLQGTNGTMKGDGYLGSITAIEIIGNVGLQEKVLNLVVKTASKNDALREQAPISEIYRREIYMYNTVIPTFKKFQITKGRPVISSFPKCYKTTDIERSEALIFENLKCTGFKLSNQKIPMDQKHIALVMKEFANFHGLSFAFKDQNPEEYQRLIQPMPDHFCKMLCKNDVNEMFAAQCRKAADALNPIEDSNAITKILEFAATSGAFISNLWRLVDQYSVILHGDGWTNNLMFQYDDAKRPNIPTKMRFIDLQISRLGPPVLDLSYFFYACSSKDVISNFEHYLDIYYNTLSDNIKKLGSNPDKVYPKSVFRRQWRESARFGLILSMYVIKVMLSEQSEVIDLADAAETGQGILEAFGYDISNADAYNDRVKHIILHFVNNRFI